jgi:hypothetical protein
VYLNALTADFAFDDYFAVVRDRCTIHVRQHLNTVPVSYVHIYLILIPMQVRNKDVIDSDIPFSALLVHDFWYV